MAFVKESSLRISGLIFGLDFFFLSIVSGGNLGSKSPLTRIPFPMHYINIFFKSTYPFCLIFLVHSLSNIMKLAYHGVVIPIFFSFGYVKICI